MSLGKTPGFSTIVYDKKFIRVNLLVHLEVGQRLHPLNWAVGGERQGDVHRLVGWDGRHVEGLRRSQPEAVLVELDAEAVHQLHGAVVEGHVHVDGTVLAGEGASDLQTLALRCREPFLLRRDVEGGGGGAAQSKDVAKQGVG